MNKRYLAGLLILFVGLNLASAYWQIYQLPLDGDLVGLVLPAPWYATILQDPFGWSVLTKHAVYAGTSRFFAHATLAAYWQWVPNALQVLVNPIDSLYTASALLSTFTHALLLFMLAAYVRIGGGNHRAWTSWLAAALLVPMFQTYGFYEQMGITNHAITYTAFYALPMGLLLVVLWPFFRAACTSQPLRLPAWQALLLVLLMVVVAFNGPIAVAATAVILINIALYWLIQRWPTKNRRFTLHPIEGSWLSGQAIFLLGVLASLCLYSLYIGRNNSENTHDHTLRQLYQLLPQGVVQQLTSSWGLPLVLGVIAFNMLLLYQYAPATPVRQRLLTLTRWIMLFSVLYTLLLPFGGYRSYRPLLVRNDSILPVILGIVFTYGVSSYFLLLHLTRRALGLYLTLLLVLTGTFIYVDKTVDIPETNGCQRWALDDLSHAQEPIVRITDQCTVLSWTLQHDPNATALHVEMLRHWHILTKTEKFYQ